MDNNKNIDIENIENIEIFESNFDLVADEFCKKLGLENLTQATQSQWNAYLIQCNRDIISNIDIKSHNIRTTPNYPNLSSNDNAYNVYIINNIIDRYYIPLCMLYSKEISLMGVSFLFNINYATLMTWKDEKVGSLRFDIYKKIVMAREESLSNKLSTGKQNPVGIMAILNHHYAWNMPGVRTENTSKQALTTQDLPMLNCTENTNNSDTGNE